MIKIYQEYTNHYDKSLEELAELIVETYKQNNIKFCTAVTTTFVNKLMHITPDSIKEMIASNDLELRELGINMLFGEYIELYNELMNTRFFEIIYIQLPKIAIYYLYHVERK